MLGNTDALYMRCARQLSDQQVEDHRLMRIRTPSLNAPEYYMRHSQRAEWQRDSDRALQPSMPNTVFSVSFNAI